MRIACPFCGNDTDFYEVAEGVTITTFYVLNEDGSFSTVSEIPRSRGKCASFAVNATRNCGNTTEHFLDMLF